MIKNELKKGDSFYMLNVRLEIRKAIYSATDKSKRQIAAGNCFETISDIVNARAAIINILQPPEKRWWEFWK